MTGYTFHPPHPCYLLKYMPVYYNTSQMILEWIEGERVVEVAKDLKMPCTTSPFHLPLPSPDATV